MAIIRRGAVTWTDYGAVTEGHERNETLVSLLGGVGVNVESKALKSAAKHFDTHTNNYHNMENCRFLKDFETL